MVEGLQPKEATTSPEITSQRSLAFDIAVLDFDEKADYASTTPILLSYFGDTFPVSTWQQVYTALLNCLYDDYPQQAEMLDGMRIPNSMDLLFGNKTQAMAMARPERVGDSGLYAETNFSVKNLIKLMKRFLNYFLVDAENVEITYQKPKMPMAASKEAFCPEKPLPSVRTDEVKQEKPSLITTDVTIQQNSVSEELEEFPDAEFPDALADEEFLEALAEDESAAAQIEATPEALSIPAHEDAPKEAVSAMSDTPEEPKQAKASRWREILEKGFPDGYTMGDFICQLQVASMWQEHFGEPCPLEGNAIDVAIAMCGTVRDGNVFPNNEHEEKLLAEIVNLVDDTLNTYSTVYASQIFQRYRAELAEVSIFTEPVMAQQVAKEAGERFFYISNLFVRWGKQQSVENDCKCALRKRGGMMTTEAVAETLWFIPSEKVRQGLNTSKEILTLGVGQWMLAEHFPFSREDAQQVAKMLNELFLSRGYVLSKDIPELLQRHLPSIAENVSGLSSTGLFSILKYYLKEHFDFARSLVTPFGARVDFTVLFSSFAHDHEHFSLDELDAFAKELQTSQIYWESVYKGGAVRISRDEFVNRSQTHFDVAATDAVLNRICSGDYLSFRNVPVGMMGLLPACGYSWNVYLLQSYVNQFSDDFRLIYNSFAKEGCYGAMVRAECAAISDYETLVERVLTDDSTWATQADALALLVKQGYQAQRKLKGIEYMVARAKANKMNDGV